MYLGNNQCNKGYGYYACPALHEQSQKHFKKKWYWLEIQICEIMGLNSQQIQLFLLAFHCQGNFVRRNVGDSVTEIPY